MANQIIGNPSRVLDLNGYPVPGAKMTVYQSGTSTLLSVYSDLAGTILAANPVIADANGVLPQRYVTAASSKVVITDAADVPLYTLDPAPMVQATGSGASQISFAPTVTVPATDVQSAIEQVATLTAVTQLSGRNRIINGQGRVNQRSYVSGTATTGANQYTLDRWRVVTLGQNLTFTGNVAGRTMTAPAGGVEQVIEGANIEGGTYVINWVGTATCTVDGVARAKGATFTLTANTNATVRMIGGTFTDVQLELGTTATPFERLTFSQELANCQRYYERADGEYKDDSILGAATVNVGAMWYYRVTKRAVPSVSVVSQSGTAANAVGFIIPKGSDGVSLVWEWTNGTVITTRSKSVIIQADAEI